jgi:alpha/beta superfamily hydrolase
MQRKRLELSPWYLFPLCLLILTACVSTSTDDQGHRLEESICGFQEALAFWIWNHVAGAHVPARVQNIAHLRDITFSTKDKRTLRGYQLQSRSSVARMASAKGYLLVAQGNAMLAEQIIDSFQAFAEAGYDVYIFDYRGYGRSEGKSRLKAILSDYQEIIDHLDTRAYEKRRFYGISFGGIVLLDALQDRMKEARLAIDSTPGRLSNYGCPQTHDPIDNLPQDCSNIFFIVGARDKVVTAEMSKELVDIAGERGGKILRDPDLGHPFMDPEFRHHRLRLQAVRAFLLE